MDEFGGTKAGKLGGKNPANCGIKGVDSKGGGMGNRGGISGAEVTAGSCGRPPRNTEGGRRPLDAAAAAAAAAAASAAVAIDSGDPTT